MSRGVAKASHDVGMSVPDLCLQLLEEVLDHDQLGLVPPEIPYHHKPLIVRRDIVMDGS